MRGIRTHIIFYLVAAAAALADDPAVQVTSTVHAEPLPRDILTNEGIVQLSDAGFSDSFIVEKLLLSRTRFETSVEGLTYLRHNLVSEELVKYILEYSAQSAVPVSPPVGTSPALAVVPASAGQTSASGLMPMKIMKGKLLVPEIDMGVAPVSELSASSDRRRLLKHKRKTDFYSWYPAPSATGYTLPAHPMLQSPAIPGMNAPVVTPVGSSYWWIASR
ncbi:MAG: hypothetical protein JO099_03200 [Acidobacteriia bacterium]|nr:hypothetical protein [Terriglobia bacterium]